MNAGDRNPSLKIYNQISSTIARIMRPVEESSDNQKQMNSIAEKEGALIPLLQKAQSSLGYISPETVEDISEALEISESEVYGVATFYAEFKLFRPGEHNIKVCMGTSCYLKGGRRILDHLTRKLGIKPGSTTKDNKFSLETVACLGCCSKSPVMSVDGVIYGDFTSSKADSILSQLGSKA